MTYRLIALWLIAAAAGVLLAHISMRSRTRGLEKKNAALKRELAQRRKYSSSRDPWTESIVDDVCRSHPAMTREEAREAIDASGF
jgi:hypothetical protein